MNIPNLGYTKPLYILPFDHRSTFAQKMFNLASATQLNEEERHLIKEFKMLIYKGFKKAVENGIGMDGAAILCDEEFGSEVLIDAKHNGFITILTVEKSGEEEFKFQYGNEFAEHIERFKPTFTKVLIKYNTEDGEDLKQRQKTNLKIISDFSHKNKFKFLLEVLVIPTDNQLSQAGSREEYDRKMRPGLTEIIIKDLQGFGIEPDVWKLEGFESQTDYEQVIKAIKYGGRDNVNLVILGRGAGEEKVDEWLKTGSKVEGVIGFAVGRTIFWDILDKFYKGEVGKGEVIETVSKNFLNFYKIFTNQ